MKRYLILGNGFDLSHNLPTSYGDFLYVITKFMNAIDSNYKIVLESKYNNVKELSKDMYDNINTVYNKFYEKYKDDQHIIDLIKNNIWINYFIKLNDKSGQNWFDFEQAIFNVCSVISDYIKFNEEQFLCIDINIDERLKNFEINNDFILNNIIEYDLSDDSINKMSEDLENLKIILTLYLNIVSEIEIKIFDSEILDFSPTNVINFNYTNTLEKIYYNDVPTDYIHGNLIENNIVLGINNLNDRHETLFSDFIKYYQMIYNNINVENYLDLKAINDLLDKEIIISMFFGHSLDYNDKDVIKQILEKSKKVFIFYHDDRSRAFMIKNLMDILDKKTFKEYFFRKNKKIEFVHIKNKVSGVMTKKEIDDLFNNFDLESLENKIELICERKKYIGIYDLIRIIETAKNNKYNLDSSLIKKFINYCEERNSIMGDFEKSLIEIHSRNFLTFEHYINKLKSND